MGPNGSEVGRARVAQAVPDLRRGRHQGRKCRILRVEQAKRVRLQPPPLEFRKFHVMTTEIGREPLEIGGPARRISDRVEQNLDLGHARLYVEAVAHLDHLGVHGGARIADRLGIPLPELAVSASLRAVVAEHRPHHAQLHRLRPRVHSVLHERPNDARRGLRA